MSEAPELIIEAGRTERQYWRDLWRYRELFYFLAWRDILVRYKQTTVGVGWSFFRPLLTMFIFTFLFKKVAKLPDDGIPYPLTSFAGILAWNFFAVSLQESGNSLLGNANLISKVYFPRLVVPVSTVITAFVDFLIAFSLFVGMMVWYRFVPSIHIFALPIFIAMAMMAAIGCGLWVSALTVRFRDIRFLVPFIVQFGIFASPVGIRSSDVPEKYQLLYALNPLTGVIDGFRWSLLGGSNHLNPVTMATSVVIITFLAISGFRFFRKFERTFADVI